MDKEFIMATAKTAEQQILWSINKWEYMSWGIRQKSALEYEGMATLALRVSGAVHKGWVFISLNEGKDCYEVRLLNVARTKVKRTLDEVYCDNLGQVLDGLIERKAEWTDAQYKDKAARDSARKMGMQVIDVSKKKAEPMVIDGVRYRPATLEEIDGRDMDLYMNGERVYVLMVCRSETIETGESKLDYITLTNMKKVQVEDLYVIDNDSNEPNKEDQTMNLNLSNNNNESGNAAKQQVSNNASEPIVKQVDVMGLMGALNRDGHAKLSDHVIEDAEAEEVKDEQAEEIESVNVGEVTLATIMPKMTAIANDNANDNDNKPVAPTKQEVAEAISKAANEGKATTMPLGSRGTLVIGGIPKTTKSGKPSDRFDLEKDKPERKPKATKSGKPQVSSLPRVTLVTYVTKRGETAPRIIGFSGEDDPRWKPIHDEKQTMIAAYNKAKKKDPKAKMTSSPFGPAWLTDREGNGEKTYCMTFGVKYMEVAKQLCAAYNTNDRDQWAKAEQAVRDTKAGIAAGYQAEREAKRAARKAANDNGNGNGNGNGNDNKPAAPAMSNEEQAMFDLFKKFMAGDKEAVAMVNAMKAA